MEESKENTRAVVINSNILFSSLIKEEGFTRAVFLFLKGSMGIKLMIPSTVVGEFKAHIGEIARKSGLSFNDVSKIFENLIENVEKVGESGLKEEVEESINYVKDEKDAPFVAVALKHRPSYILTYNKKDYKIKTLKNLGISVMTPKEALDLVGIERLELETKEKRKRNIRSYLTKLKMLIKK